MEDPTILLKLGKFALLPIGVLLFVAAAWLVRNTRAWLARALEVPGEVIDMVRERDDEDRAYLYSPVVRFKAADGRTHEFQSALRTNPPAYRTGEVVAVLYDPKVPVSAAIRGLWSLWLTPIVLAFIGTIFFAIGMVMIAIG